MNNTTIPLEQQSRTIVIARKGQFKLSSLALKKLGMTQEEVQRMPRDSAKLVALVEVLGRKVNSGLNEISITSNTPIWAKWEVKPHTEHGGFETIIRDYCSENSNEKIEKVYIDDNNILDFDEFERCKDRGDGRSRVPECAPRNALSFDDIVSQPTLMASFTPRADERRSTLGETIYQGVDNDTGSEMIDSEELQSLRNERDSLRDEVCDLEADLACARSHEAPVLCDNNNIEIDNLVSDIKTITEINAKQAAEIVDLKVENARILDAADEIACELDKQSNPDDISDEKESVKPLESEPVQQPKVGLFRRFWNLFKLLFCL